MRYVAFVVLDGLYAAESAGGLSGPVVVHREGLVLDANAEALSAGISRGARLTEAVAVMRGNGQRVPWTEEPFVGAQRRWLNVAARYSDTVEPTDQHEAFIDLTGHPRPRDAAQRMREALIRETGLDVRIGIASCRWIAKIATGIPDHLGQAHSDPTSFVSRLPVAALPIDPAQARTLELLGYRRAEDVAALDFTVLHSQFGKEADTIRRYALGLGDATVRQLFPPNSAAVRHVFEGGAAESRQSFDAGLRALAEELGETLQAGDLTGKRAEVFLEHEDGTVTALSRTFARPIASAKGVFRALELMFDEDPARPPEAVRVRLPELEKARRTQLAITGERSRSDREEGVRVAIGNVRKAFGDTAVMLAADKPERREVLVQRAFERANGFRWNS